MKNEPLVSVITIVYNGVNDIGHTIESVLNQDYENFEFIVIDGGSNDGTQKVIQKYKDQITYYVSEKDKGIYDAMNKGILVSKGTWVNFMNAGDKFCNNSVLSSVFKHNTILEQFSLIYGYKYSDGVKTIPHKIDVLKKGIIMANHQSMFFNSEKLGEDLYYSLNYPIYGDYDLVSKIFLKYGQDSFEYINKPIAIYEGGGISSITSFQKRKDKYVILFKRYGLFSLIKGLIFSIIKK
jgi:glycosyltransferase involved in cell wall biosynthesis